MVRVHVDGIHGWHGSTFIAERGAGIWVYIEARKVTAGNVQTDAMSGLENVRSGIKMNGEFINLARLHELRLMERITVARPDNAVLQVRVNAPREVLDRRMHVDQLGGKVRVNRV